ncbi:MAG: hypothetical protein ACLSVD_18690, partial [Eggerthellaceae bacterium]
HVERYYAIFGQRVIDALKEQGYYQVIGSPEFWVSGMLLYSQPIEDLDKSLQDAVDTGWVFKGDTIADVAEQAGLAELEATVEAYDAMAAAGKDTLFGKRAEMLVPVADGGPLPVRHNPGAFNTSADAAPTHHARPSRRLQRHRRPVHRRRGERQPVQPSLLRRGRNLLRPGLQLRPPGRHADGRIRGLTVRSRKTRASMRARPAPSRHGAAPPGPPHGFELRPDQAPSPSSGAARVTGISTQRTSAETSNAKPPRSPSIWAGGASSNSTRRSGSAACRSV